MFVVGGLDFEFCVFVAGWRHALRSEWPFIIIIITLEWGWPISATRRSTSAAVVAVTNAVAVAAVVAAVTNAVAAAVVAATNRSSWFSVFDLFFELRRVWDTFLNTFR